MSTMNPGGRSEAQMRRLAARQELQLRKSRSRTPERLDYGRYWLIDPYINALVYPTGPMDSMGANLEEIEEVLSNV